MSLSVTVTGARELKRAFKKVQKDTKKRMKDAVRESAKNIRRRARKNLASNRTSKTKAGNFTRKTAKSIKYRVRGEQATVTAGFPAHILEGGTEPFWPRVDELHPWANKKLTGGRGAAFLAARAISETGIAPTPFFQPAYDEERKPHRSRVEKALLGVPLIRRG